MKNIIFQCNPHISGIQNNHVTEHSNIEHIIEHTTRFITNHINCGRKFTEKDHILSIFKDRRLCDKDPCPLNSYFLSFLAQYILPAIICIYASFYQLFSMFHSNSIALYRLYVTIHPYQLFHQFSLYFYNILNFRICYRTFIRTYNRTFHIYFRVYIYLS